jgi:conjugal transfer pilus assembly protein TraA
MAQSLVTLSPLQRSKLNSELVELIKSMYTKASALVGVYPQIEYVEASALMGVYPYIFSTFGVFHMSKKQVLGVLALVAAGAALATASTDTTFTTIVTLLTSWSQGSLGRVLALGMFVVGIAAGIVRQSVMAAVAGIAGALVMNYGPTVIDGVFGALI